MERLKENRLVRDMQKCPFCNINPNDIIFRNDHGFVIYDKFPASEGHMLIIPYTHYRNYFDNSLCFETKVGLWDLIEKCKSHLDFSYYPDGYNIGINIGEHSGQTVNHLHIHIIPRYKGDVENPTGGIRGCIPDQRVYK